MNFFDTNPLVFIKKVWEFMYKYGALFLIYLAPIDNYLYCVYILLFLDLFTGIYKSKRKNIPITSKKLRTTIVKYLFYSIAIYVGFEIDVKIIEATNDYYLSRLVAGSIALTELYSILENISVITGTDILTLIKERVARFTTNLLKGKIDED